VGVTGALAFFRLKFARVAAVLAFMLMVMGVALSLASYINQARMNHQHMIDGLGVSITLVTAYSFMASLVPGLTVLFLAIMSEYASRIAHDLHALRRVADGEAGDD
jgi:Na+/melibiose symporter-like transporter